MKIDHGVVRLLLGDELLEPNESRLDVFSKLAHLFFFFLRSDTAGRIFPVLAEAERSSSSLTNFFGCLTLGDQLSLATRVYLTSGLEGGVPSEMTLICWNVPEVGGRLNDFCCNSIASFLLMLYDVLPEEEFKSSISLLETGECSFVLMSGDSVLEEGWDDLRESIE